MKIIPVEVLWNKFLNEYRNDLLNIYKKEELIASDSLFKKFAELCKSSDLFLMKVEVDFLDDVEKKVEEIKENQQEVKQPEVKPEPKVEEKPEKIPEEDLDEDLKEILGD